MPHSWVDQTWVVGPFQCNCRLLVCPRTGTGLLIDPGDEPELILSRLKGVKLPTGQPVEIRYLLHTHGHLDHIGGTRRVKTQLSQAQSSERAPRIAIHRDDEPLYLGLKTQGQLFGMCYEDPLPVDHYLEDGEELKVGDLRISVLHTPGHSPGGVCLRLHEDSRIGIPESLFSGDTLFQSSIGRTDLWGGDLDTLIRSIRSRILTLDSDTRLCPGHGPESSIGREKKENPFLL